MQATNSVEANDDRDSALFDGNILKDNQYEEIRDPEKLANLATMCDVAYDGVPAGAAINFNPSFGKISMGEHFKVLFTIQNKISKHPVEELRIKATLNSVPKPKGGKDPVAPEKANEITLMSTVVNRLAPKEPLGFVISFKVDREEHYHLQIEMDYTSKYFSEQLNSF